MNPLFSVVVCTYNRAAVLQDLLETLSSQELSKNEYEVVVIDNNSTDNTAEIVQDSIQKNGNICYYFESKQGISHARNRGWKEAKGAYVAYTDDDCRIPKTWLSFAQSIVDSVSPPVFGGPYYPFYNDPKPRWFKDEYGSHTEGETARFLDSEYLTAGNIFIRSDLFADFKGFDCDLGMSGGKIGLGEETEFLDRIRNALGHQSIYYHPELYVYHLVSPNKFSMRYQLGRRFIGGRTSTAISQKRYSELWWLKETIKVLISLSFKASLGITFRNRKQYPFIENYVCEVVCRTVGGAGRVYEHYTQKIRHLGF